MNRLILLLKSTSQDLFFLQQLKEPANLIEEEREKYIEYLFKYILGAYNAVRLIEEETFELFYDEDILLHCLKDADNDSYPNPKLVKAFFNDFTDYRYAEEFVDTTVKVAGIEYKNSILGALLYNTQYVCCVVNHEAINRDYLYHVETSPELSKCTFSIVNCTSKDLHNWFVEKRIPERKYDFDYDKHPTHASECDAPYIASQSYSEEKIKEFLKKAVGIKGNKRRYYKISDSEIAVFCDENIQDVPTFHGYEIKTSNLPEMQKIMKSNLHKKIEELK